LRAVRERIGRKIEIMVDYNQALSVDEALARGKALDRRGGLLARGADPA
jgi:mandelate racemase